LVLSPEEIAKVKEEWEEKQKKKKEKEKEKEKEDTEKDKAASEPGDKSNGSQGKEAKLPKSTEASQSAPKQPATHERYSLHRDFFAMRLSEHRKRRQATQAKELAPRLPGAPRDAVADSSFTGVL